MFVRAQSGRTLRDYSTQARGYCERMSTAYGSGSFTQLEPGKWRLRVYLGRDHDRAHLANAHAPTAAPRRAPDAHSLACPPKRRTEETSTPRTRRSASSSPSGWRQSSRTRRPKTISKYRAKVRGRIEPALGNVRLDRLTPQKLDRQYSAWRAEGLSASTVHHLAAIIGTACNQAMKWGWIATNPVTRSSPPPLRSRPPTVPEPAQLLELIAAAETKEDHTLATAIALAALTGARRGELCALRWSALDLKHGTVRIAHSLTVVGGETHVGPTKTHAERAVALGDAGVATLLRRRIRIEESAAKVGVPLDADPYVLSYAPRADKHAGPDYLSHQFAKLCGSLGIRFRFHDLRHFAATQLIGADVDVRTVANRLGHADTSTTLNIYAHPLTERDEHAANVLGALLPARSLTTAPAAEVRPKCQTAQVATTSPRPSYPTRDRALEAGRVLGDSCS